MKHSMKIAEAYQLVQYRYKKEKDRKHRRRDNDSDSDSDHEKDIKGKKDTKEKSFHFAFTTDAKRIRRGITLRGVRSLQKKKRRKCAKPSERQKMDLQVGPEVKWRRRMPTRNPMEVLIELLSLMSTIRRKRTSI